MISVVITAYNVEKYIEQAMRSVLEQTFYDIECIVVNDCSSDSTSLIIEKLASEDKRVKIITNETNKGAGASRRRGIEAAAGEYILLLDGDDWLEKDFISTLYKKAVQTGAEIVSGGIKVVQSDGSWQAESYGDCITEGREKVERFWGEKVVFMNNKLIHRRLHELVPYCTRRFIEDTPTIIPQLYFANKVAYVDNIGYNYRMQEESLTHTASRFKYILFRLLCIEELVTFFEEHDKEYLETIPLGLGYAELVKQMKNISPTKEDILPYNEEWQEFTLSLLKRVV